jgi:hypothetical protein
VLTNWSKNAASFTANTLNTFLENLLGSIKKMATSLFKRVKSLLKTNRPIWSIVTIAVGFSGVLRSKTDRKYAIEWLKSHWPGYLMKRPMPWIVYPAYEFLNASLPQNLNVFEYGSGGSTLYWLRKKNGRCVSIEHDLKWYETICLQLQKQPNGHQVECRLVEPEQAPLSPDIIHVADPKSYADEKVPGCSFERYVKQIDEFPDGYFDVVMVDGRARASCIIHGAGKVKPGGMLIIDNPEYVDFQYVDHVLKGMKKKIFRGIPPLLNKPTQTNIYIQP